MIASNETIIQIDFSENYVCKFGEEAQAMHFGASKVQLSLHTGVQYLYNTNIGTNIVESFATVSTCLDHSAPAIWAHLGPVLHKLNDKHPEVNTIHFVSDGPTAQYRNRFNLWYMSQYLPSQCPQIQRVTWNYSEAGHGKGPMDGIGGVLKRTADKYVCFGNDIGSVADFVTVLQNKCNVDLKEISAHNIETVKNQMSTTIANVPGLMDLHQVTWSKESPTTIYTRCLSCFECSPDSVCLHFKVGKGKVVFSSCTRSEGIL